jgi:cytochrome b561
MFRESEVKPTLYVLFVVLISLFVIWAVDRALEILGPPSIGLHHRLFSWIIGVAIFLIFVYLMWHRELLEFMLPSRFWLDSRHFGVGVGVMIVGTVALLIRLKQLYPGGRIRKRVVSCFRCTLIAIGLALAVLSGLIMLIHPEALGVITPISYLVFDLSLVLIVVGVILVVFREIVSAKVPVVKGQSGG